MVTPIQKKSISYEIVDRIMALFMSGDLKPGDRLPSERDLAIQYRVSRVSVREAIKILSISGIVESRPGSGTFVINTPFDAKHEDSSSTFTLDDAILQSVEMRMIVEPKIARLAAEYITVDELAEFDELISKMKTSSENDDFGSFALHDMQFHYLCASASKNPALYNTLRKYSGSSLHVTMIQQFPGALIIPFQHHSTLVEAFRSHDADRAESIMCKHIYHVFSKCAGSADNEVLNKRIQSLSGVPLT